MDYIELSGLGVVNLTPPESPASVYVLAGPAIGINVKCEAAGEDCGDDGLKTLDLGITGGDRYGDGDVRRDDIIHRVCCTLWGSYRLTAKERILRTGLLPFRSVSVFLSGK